jgi:hypothetical protein
MAEPPSRDATTRRNRGHDQRPNARLRAQALSRRQGARDAHEIEATRFGVLKAAAILSRTAVLLG